MKIDISQLEFVDKKLRNLVLWIETKTGLEFTITSLYRIDDSGVHGTLPLRGIDLRMRHRAVGEKVEELINSYWTYDVDRIKLKCAVLHGKNKNLHLHIQVHPKTEQL